MTKTVTISSMMDSTYNASTADTLYEFTATSAISVVNEDAITAASSAKDRTIRLYGSVSASAGAGIVMGTENGKGAGDIEIGATGHIMATTGIITNSVDQTLENGGKIEADNVGVSMLGDHSVASNSGRITAENWAVVFLGDQASLHNSGNVDGKSAGIIAYGAHLKVINDFHIGSQFGAAVEATNGVIINHADIEGYAGIYLNGDAADKVSIINTGNLLGTGDAIFGSAGRETVHNSGTITGDLTLQGGNDRFVNDGGTVSGIINGGKGNDTYVVDSDLELVEDGHAGRDTVRSSVSFTLADNFEVLQLTGKGSIIGVGNAGNNRLIGNDGNNLLGGGAGNDLLTGHGGADTFVFKNGDNQDTVTDFSLDGKHHDIAAIVVDGIESFGDLKGHISQVGSNVVLTFGGGGSLTLDHIHLHDLVAADFSFS